MGRAKIDLAHQIDDLLAACLVCCLYDDAIELLSCCDSIECLIGENSNKSHIYSAVALVSHLLEALCVRSILMNRMQVNVR